MERDISKERGKAHIVKSRCNMCHPRCGINVHSAGNKIIEIDGMPEHPYKFLCVKGHAIPELVHSSDRLTNPLRKIDGKFREISWEDAFSFIADKLADIKKEYGAKSIVLHTGIAYVGTIVSEILRRFGDVLGTPNYTSGAAFCWFARTIGFNLTVGDHICPDYNWATRCAVVWGHNPAATNPELADKVNIVKARGGRLIVVDPREIPLAKRADIHAQIRPGTDCALALGILNVIITEELFDKSFVEQWTVGFDRLIEHVKEYPPERAEEITRVSSKKIRDIARMYATNKPASLSLGLATDQSTNGIQTIRAIATLIAITGNLDVSGGNIILPPRMTWPKLRVEENVAHDTAIGADYPIYTKYARMEQQTTPILDVMLTEKPYPIKALINFGCNLAMTWSDTNKVRKAIQKLGLFVVCDIFMTETAKMADVVLPGTTFMERDNLRDYRNMGIPLFFLANKAIEPVGNCMEDWKIIQGIARRMGYGEYFSWERTEELFDFVLKPSGNSLDKLRQSPGGIYYGEKISRKYLKEGFHTPSKKVEIYSSILQEYGYEPLPTFHEPPESPVSNPELAKEYPLIMITGIKVLPFTHSQYHNIPSLRRLLPEPLVEINTRTAAELGINDGDLVRVENRKGKIKLKAKVTDEILPGVIAIEQGWSEANVNLLTNMDAENRDPISGYPGLRQVLCRVTKVE